MPTPFARLHRFAHMHVNACSTLRPAAQRGMGGLRRRRAGHPSRSDKRSTRRANLRRAHEVIGIPKSMTNRQLLDEDRWTPYRLRRERRLPEVITAVAEHGLQWSPKSHGRGLAALSSSPRLRANGVELMVNWPTPGPAIAR